MRRSAFHCAADTTMALADDLLTESRNPHSESIDSLTALDFVRSMNSEDAHVVAAVAAEAEPIARRGRVGGRATGARRCSIYVGAGTSGRLGVLDAAECPPTFSTPPEMVVGLIAGGTPALVRAVEGAEDDPDRGAADIVALNVNEKDLVIGIATSGRTPYVIGALAEARRRGAATVGIACNRPSPIGQAVDLEIAPLVGPEIISGSTRLKGGTATKMILNMISTGAMVRIGKTLGNWMVDLQPSNEKLAHSQSADSARPGGRGRRSGRPDPDAVRRTPETVLVVALTGIDPDAAQTLLDCRTMARFGPRSRRRVGEIYRDAHRITIADSAARRRRRRDRDGGVACSARRARARSRNVGTIECQSRRCRRRAPSNRRSDHGRLPCRRDEPCPGRCRLFRVSRFRPA